MMKSSWAFGGCECTELSDFRYYQCSVSLSRLYFTQLPLTVLLNPNLKPILSKYLMYILFSWLIFRVKSKPAEGFCGVPARKYVLQTLRSADRGFGFCTITRFSKFCPKIIRPFYKVSVHGVVQGISFRSVTF